MTAHVIVARWADGLPPPCTSERVADDFWYVRLPGIVRRWIPIEVTVDQRSVRLVSHVIIPPEENHAKVYGLLLRHNFEPEDASFSLAPDGVICLVARIRLEGLSDERLDEAAGAIVQRTEETFRSILQIGFASRMRR